MTENKTDRKDRQKFSGVMLALKIEDAKELNYFLTHSGERPESIAKISKRIEKQIERQAIIKALKVQGLEPTKENINRAITGGSNEK